MAGFDSPAPGRSSPPADKVRITGTGRAGGDHAQAAGFIVVVTGGLQTGTARPQHHLGAPQLRIVAIGHRQAVERPPGVAFLHHFPGQVVGEPHGGGTLHDGGLPSPPVIGARDRRCCLRIAGTDCDSLKGFGWIGPFNK